MSYKVFENGDGGSNDEALFSYVLEGLRLIETDALGGAGSRGCGQVIFRVNVENPGTKRIAELTPEDFPTIEQV